MVLIPDSEYNRCDCDRDGADLWFGALADNELDPNRFVILLPPPPLPPPLALALARLLLEGPNLGGRARRAMAGESINDDPTAGVVGSSARGTGARWRMIDGAVGAAAPPTPPTPPCSPGDNGVAL